MNYIVLDLEFNQSYDFKTGSKYAPNPECLFEIIQIGAVKLNENLEEIERFSVYIKPKIYKRMHPYVEKITGITLDMLKDGMPFKYAYDMFSEFVSPDDVLCCWGVDDIKNLFKNIVFYNLDVNAIPNKYINVQTIASAKINGGMTSDIIGLKNAVTKLNIPIDDSFHDALNDAVYTGRVLLAIGGGLNFTKEFNISELQFFQNKTKKSKKTSDKK